MIEFENTALILTARMAGSALPGRPMMDVAGKPLVLAAIANARQAKLGDILVAAGENPIAEAVRRAGGEALVVPAQLSAEADQAAALLSLRDPHRRYQHVLIFSCAYAAIEALALRRCLAGLLNKEVDVATLATAMAEGESARAAVIAPLAGERELAYVRDFVVPGRGPGFAHVPIHAWRRGALERFASLPPDPRERQGGPEGWRGLFHGLKLVAVKVDTEPLSVDTPGDLEALRRLMKA